MDIRPTTGDSSWFTHDRFGMFIHWGIYALGARHEWIQQRERLGNQEYQRYFDHFDPDMYDPDAWAQAAADAGMKYVVVTTKHHEGFCLWDSALTDFKATNTPAGRDLIGPLVDACRRRGLRVGFYYSLIDWHHGDFIIDSVHPLRGHPERKKLNQGRDPRKYRAYLHGQVRELLTQFGDIDVMFFDFSYADNLQGWQAEGGEWVGKGRDDWGSVELLAMVRQLQPGILVNDRLDLSDEPGGWDYKTPEQYRPEQWVEVDGERVVWEACHTFSGSWGYHRDEASWKSVEQTVRLLIDTVSNGGNVLLNVGPTARGEFDQRALAGLRGIGTWLKSHGRGIYGCTAAPAEFECPQDCRLTYNPDTNRIYVHVFAWPFRHLFLHGFGGKVAYAQLLNDASEIKLVEKLPGYMGMKNAERASRLILELPVLQPDVTVPVIEMMLK